MSANPAPCGTSRAEHYFLNPVSPTFHGRDIFAPTAGWLSKAFQTEAFGEVITDFVRFTMPKAKSNGQAVKGVVLRVDAFGNLMTNLKADDIPIGALGGGAIKLAVNGKQVAQVCADIRFREIRERRSLCLARPGTWKLL